jgi:aminoglycoside phosphotransferase (APT) family kinase protein
MTARATPALRDVLDSAGLPGAPELAFALKRLNEGVMGGGHVAALWKLKTNVYRVELESRGAPRSFVLKSSNPALARRNRLVANRWLPKIGLSDDAARLVGSSGDAAGERIWLIYEDLGDATLQATAANPRHVEAAVDLLARLHTRSADHPLLPECRYHGADLGAAYFTANVKDAIRGLEMLRPPRISLTADQEETRDRLLLHLRLLRDGSSTRLQHLAVHGGPDVLLHGDPWTTNIFVTDAPDELRARFVDWDHAGVGPAAYDLSIFLLRFPPDQRMAILDRYRANLSAVNGWTLPGTWQLNALFETAECARYANRVVWPAVAVLVDHAEWAFDELAMVADWFDAFQPVLPRERTGA